MFASTHTTLVPDSVVDCVFDRVYPETCEIPRWLAAYLIGRTLEWVAEHQAAGGSLRNARQRARRILGRLEPNSTTPHLRRIFAECLRYAFPESVDA